MSTIQKKEQSYKTLTALLVAIYSLFLSSLEVKVVRGKSEQKDLERTDQHKRFTQAY